ALTYSVWSKTAHAGDAVHAVTAFPVTVGTTVAIPAGTYVEGVVDKVWRRASANHPALQIHFTRMLFANGYTVSLESATTEASAAKPSADLSAAAARGERERDEQWLCRTTGTDAGAAAEAWAKSGCCGGRGNGRSRGGTRYSVCAWPPSGWVHHARCGLANRYGVAEPAQLGWRPGRSCTCKRALTARK